MVQVTSPTAGTVFQVRVQPGESVGKGHELLTLESMKMEIPVEAPVAGRVHKLLADVGAFVNVDQVLAEIEPA